MNTADAMEADAQLQRGAESYPRASTTGVRGAAVELRLSPVRVERSLIRRQPPEPEDGHAAETIWEFQRCIVVEHKARRGRVHVATPGVVRRAKGDRCKLLREHRAAVQTAKQRALHHIQALGPGRLIQQKAQRHD
ncbi:hypothetical protein [Mangrovicoccus sp. HB161399]|uniref:hypothetical protein n=1 Tax=Mangrovicoccus sp. HB161399 TaxID=2720392 RepID=UPI001553CC39|nr:hypothetical protein [Mangrovicoccus sp. HB161399]